ncbi:MAG: SLC13 family permease [Verrucomicrobiota bacterium]
MITEAFHIPFVLLLLPATVLCLAKEWVAPEIAAMTAFSLLIAFGVLSAEEAMAVFSNPAPITIGALFIITFALDKSGGLNSLAKFIRDHLPQSLNGILFSISSLVAIASAFVNNTPIVALFMPLLLGLARARDIAPSKLLIPLSYASIMGGCCTLIGTSTNIIVSGIMVKDYGMEPISMFELTKIGVPMLLVGTLYIAFISPKLIPERSNVTASLSEEERRTFFCQLLVKPSSPWVGKALLNIAVGQNQNEFRIIEVRRQGATLMLPLSQIKVEPYDRILISAASKSLEEQEDGMHLKQDLAESWGVNALSTLQGGIMEGVITQHSNLVGRTIESVNFRQRQGMLVLAVHRKGKNLTKNFSGIRLQFGDTLLLLGPEWRFDEMRNKGDLMLLDEAQEPEAPKSLNKKPIWAWITMATVVMLATFNVVPIVGAAIMGAVFLLLLRLITPEDAIKAVDWSILFLIFGMLGVGLAMQTTGAAQLIAESSIGAARYIVPEAWLPYVALSIMILLTSVLTELLSNNATAAVMAPVGYNLALSLGLDARPFTIGVMLAASLAFTTPIGYQTNTMVYNAGGYRFGDFVRVGLPLNLLYWLIASCLIPVLWPFQNTL